MRLSLALVLLLLFSTTVARAVGTEFSKSAANEDGEWLQGRIDSAGAGEVIEVPPGVYEGNFLVNQSLTLNGKEGAVLDGGGAGHVVFVDSPNVSLKGLTIRDSGEDLENQDSGVFVTQRSNSTSIKDCRVLNSSFGIWINGAEAAIKNNIVVGKNWLPSAKRGNGVELWDADGSRVVGNRFEGNRDGIYLTVTDSALLEGNYVTGARYGVHFMYSLDNMVLNNTAEGNRKAGFTPMYTDNVVFRNCTSINNSGYGLLDRDFKNGLAENCTFVGNEKGMLVYGSQRNAFRNNLFMFNLIGVHVTAGSMDNEYSGNSFVLNKKQVKYLGHEDQVWGEEGGNYWSDYTGTDVDGDGVGDVPYRAVGLMDVLIWRHPSLKLLMTSPAVSTIQAVQADLPILQVPSVVDDEPRMAPTRKDWRKYLDYRYLMDELSFEKSQEEGF